MPLRALYGLFQCPKIFKNCLSRFQNWGRGLATRSPDRFCTPSPWAFPPGLNSQEPPTPPTVPVLAPLLPCTPSNPTGQPPTPPREQTPAKRPVSHRKREPFRPFLYAFFNSRNSPFYCCKKFNFSRSLNVSPIVAQSPDENPFLQCPKIPKIRFLTVSGK